MQHKNSEAKQIFILTNHALFLYSITEIFDTVERHEKIIMTGEKAMIQKGERTSFFMFLMSME